MGEFEVTQRTKDSFFSATKLLKQWNNENGTKKVIGHFFELEGTEVFIKTIMKDESFTHRDSVYVKSRASRGTTSGTWMHPYLFIDFAMWINPKFKLQVIKFVSDQLIDFRHEAGDNYRELSSAVQQFKGIDYKHMARALNYIVFNTHKKELRQTATEKQLDDLRKIQKHYAFAVNTGLIKSWADLLEHMRTMWAVKWNGGI